MSSQSKKVKLTNSNFNLRLIYQNNLLLPQLKTTNTKKNFIKTEIYCDTQALLPQLLIITSLGDHTGTLGVAGRVGVGMVGGHMREPPGLLPF